jgi:hypothetical protein
MRAVLWNCILVKNVGNIRRMLLPGCYCFMVVNLSERFWCVDAGVLRGSDARARQHAWPVTTNKIAEYCLSFMMLLCAIPWILFCDFCLCLNYFKALGPNSPCQFVSKADTTDALVLVLSLQKNGTRSSS